MKYKIVYDRYDFLVPENIVFDNGTYYTCDVKECFLKSLPLYMQGYGDCFYICSVDENNKILDEYFIDDELENIIQQIVDYSWEFNRIYSPFDRENFCSVIISSLISEKPIAFGFFDGTIPYYIKNENDLIEKILIYGNKNIVKIPYPKI